MPETDLGCRRRGSVDEAPVQALFRDDGPIVAKSAPRVNDAKTNPRARLNNNGNAAHA